MANQKSMTSGKHIVVLGLFLQIIFFGVFVVTSGLFHQRIVRSPTAESVSVPWQKYMYALYGASGLILVRSVFRIIEFTGGNDGTLASHEIYLYIFDGVLMLGVLVLFNLVHPGDIIGRRAQRDGIILSDRESDGEGLRPSRK
jgi:hypothetical protein